ncbi:MAG: hypothetical protein OXL41_13395 [Nitrospinae bacterium]|nr:hypothetical protein [Nitrospinota bacterium]
MKITTAEPGSVVMSEAVSLIGTHERTLADLVDEGFGVPEEAALLVYRDRTRDRGVRLICPNVESARARADALVKMKKARRRDLVLLPLTEALR